MPSKVHICRMVELPNGQKKQVNFYGETKKEVNQKYQAFLKNLEHEDAKAKAPYFAEVAQAYLDSRSASSVTMIGYRQKVRALSEAFKNRLIDSITYDELQRYVNSLDELSVNTIRKYITHLKGVFSFAQELGYVKRSPATRLKMPTTAQKARTPRWYTAEEARSLIEHAKGCGKKGLAVIIPLKSGLRPGEVAAINIKRDFDPVAKELHICESIKIPQSGEKVGKPKTESSTRTVPIDDELVEALMPYRETEYLFDNGHGKPVNYNNFLKHYIEPVFKDAPVPMLHPHDLRHTYGTLLYESGTNLYDIMAVMGHSDIKVTQVYVHQDKRKLAERIKLSF